MVKRHPRRELRCDLRPLPKMQLNPLQSLKQMRQEQYVFEHVRKKKILLVLVQACIFSVSSKSLQFTTLGKHRKKLFSKNSQSNRNSTDVSVQDYH